jgi:hypothetical protein
MKMNRDAFLASKIVVAMAVAAGMVATAVAAPPQAAPTPKPDAASLGGNKGGEGTRDEGKKAGSKEEDGGKDKEGDSGPPACIHCGATCGLTAICVCEPGTKKKTRIEFASRREPVCIPGCGGPEQRVGCTDCDAEPCACPGRVRLCNRLLAENVTEEVPAVVRKVRYVCRCCEATCGGRPRHEPCWHWTTLLRWWSSWTPAYGSSR